MQAQAASVLLGYRPRILRCESHLHTSCPSLGDAPFPVRRLLLPSSCHLPGRSWPRAPGGAQPQAPGAAGAGIEGLAAGLPPAQLGEPCLHPCYLPLRAPGHPLHQAGQGHPLQRTLA